MKKEKSKENNQFYYNRGYLDAREKLAEEVEELKGDKTIQWYTLEKILEIVKGK